MAPTHSSSKVPQRGLERVRDQILTALHFGRLRPGDRAPSVRRLADLTGMNRKTVHRAYRRLAREGLLDLRPGSGTYISEKNGRASGDPSTNDLMAAINRCRAEAARLGVPPRVFSDFLLNFMGTGLRGAPLSVVECNREQLGLICQDLQVGLGVQPQPVSLSELTLRRGRALGDSLGVITTDCHWSEVSSLLSAEGAPLYRIALDPGFPQLVAQHARHGRVLMIVSDPGFAPVFQRLLRQLAVADEHLRRVTFVEPAEARPALAQLEPGAAVHVSPLVEEPLSRLLPEHCRPIQARWHVAAGSMDRLRARLSLDLALRRRRIA